MAPTQVIASARSWIEGDAVRQLEQTAQLPGMVRGVGLPDLHPGRGAPIGAVFATRGVVYPHLVGSDLGCGMALWSTGLLRRKARRDRWVEQLRALERPFPGDLSALRAEHGLPETAFDRALGTVGGGNHFVELQQVEQVLDPVAAAAVGLDRDRLCLLTHSGSRGLGESILRGHLERHGAGGLTEGTPEAARYRTDHDLAVRWARANRALIAARFLGCLGAEGTPRIDLCHNDVSAGAVDGERCLLHRKGAAPADRGAVVIPGSRGALSYVVQPAADCAHSLDSLAHGAGRKWTRSAAYARMKERARPEELVRTELGSAVICEDKALLYEEAPEAYKRIDGVIDDLVGARLATVVATLRPLITYKVSLERSG